MIPRNAPIHRSALATTDLSDTVTGARAISAETAVLLGFRFETSPQFWLRLQAAHDPEQARRISKQKINEQLRAFRNGMHSGGNHGAGQVDTTQQDIARLERWAAELDAIA